MAKYNLTGTKTLANLTKAFLMEAIARNMYTLYAEIAEDEKYVTIRNTFLETAGNEFAHAEMFYEYLADAGIKTNNAETELPVHIGNTLTNLYQAAQGEYQEWTDYYPAFSKQAQEEGFDAIALSFKDIASIEGRHYQRFINLYERMKADMLFKNKTPVMWFCSNCGFEYEGLEAYKFCPACHHSQRYFYIGCNSVLPIENSRYFY